MSQKDSEHYTRLISMYESARINSRLFINSKMEIESGLCRISLPLREDYYHAMGAAHGAVYFKLLDDAAFFAVQSQVIDYFVVTTSFNIHLVRPVASGELHAEGRVKFQSRNHFVAESKLFNERGKEVGFGTGTFMRSRVLLSETDGYLS